MKPGNGTAFLSKCGICRPSLRAEAGGLFDLVPVDLGELPFFGFGPFPTAVTITGVVKDGSTVVAAGLAGRADLHQPRRWTEPVAPAPCNGIRDQSAAPVLSADTDAVLSEVLGLDADQIRAPREAKVLQ